MASTPEQKRQKGYAKITIPTGASTRIVKVWGTIGTLEFLGFQPEVSALLAQNGVDRVTQRKAHRRCRWLGDVVKTGVKQNQALQILYPSRRGAALPGSPVRIVNMDQKTASGARVKYTVQVDGDIGIFIAWMTEHPLSFNMKIIGPKGSPYEGMIPKAGTPSGGA